MRNDFITLSNLSIIKINVLSVIKKIIELRIIRKNIKKSILLIILNRKIQKMIKLRRRFASEVKKINKDIILNYH